MEYFKQLQTNGWEAVYSEKMNAIRQLRKLVYFLSTSVNIEALNSIIFDLNLGYLDLKGDTQKEKVLFILNYCLENCMLQAFFNTVFSLKLLPQNYVDIQTLCEVPNEIIKYISFNIPDFASCRWVRTDNGVTKIYNCHDYNENVTMRSHKKNPCERILRCDICGEILHRETEHDWDKWRYVSINSCNQKRVCRRCGMVEETYNKHTWSEWYNTPNGSKYRVCNHCHKKEYEIQGDWSGYVHWNDGTMDLWEIAFYKKNNFLFGAQLMAIIKVFVDVNINQKTCQFVIREQCKVKLDCQHINIIGKKIIEGNNYNLDDFTGNISEDCLFIEGIVSSKSARGSIKIVQRHEN